MQSYCFHVLANWSVNWVFDKVHANVGVIQGNSPRAEGASWLEWIKSPSV